MEVKKSCQWLLIRHILSNYTGENKWEDDSLFLAANWGYCYLDGKHPLTTDNEWKILDRHMNVNPYRYSEQGSKNLFYLLCDKRFELFVKLFCV